MKYGLEHFIMNKALDIIMTMSVKNEQILNPFYEISKPSTHKLAHQEFLLWF